MLASALILAVSILIAGLFALAAGNRADRVKQGLPVELVRIAGFEILSVRADLADVEPAERGSPLSPALEDLRRREVFYLGRSGSTIVLYDAATQSSWHIPASTVAVRARNCETSQETRDPLCPD